MQSQDQNKLYTTLKNVVPKAVLSNKNRAKSWVYGYDLKYDIIIISKTGEIENIIDINGLKIALPKAPKEIYKRSKRKKNSIGRLLIIQKSYLVLSLYFNGTMYQTILKVSGLTI